MTFSSATKPDFRSNNASDITMNTNISNNVTSHLFSAYFNNSEVTQRNLFDLYEAYRTKEREQLSAYRSVAYVFGTVIFLSNLTVVVSSGLILKKGQQPKSTYLLLGNVSLADTIIGISIIFGASVENASSSNPLCIFQIGMLVCPAMVSIFSVGMIAVDRYIYILHGLYYQRWCNTTRVRICIVCIWMIGVTLGFMPATGWVNHELVRSKCTYVSLFPGMLILVNSLLSLVPIILVAVLYSIILVKALKNAKQIKTTMNTVRVKSDNTPEMRVYRGHGLFVASLPAMGWTGSTFRDYRCWYISVFPPALLIIVSLMVLSVIIMVCVLYMIILHSAVRTVDRIREFQESHTVSYINEAFNYNEHVNPPVHEMSKTTITITISSQTITELSNSPIEEQELATIDSEKIHVKKKHKTNFFKMSRYLCKTKTVNNHPSKIKAVKTVLLILFCFVGTWTPYYVAIILYVKCDISKNGYDCIPLELMTLGPLYILGASNSICDPIIYAWRHSGFKRTLRKIYWRFVWNMKVFKF